MLRAGVGITHDKRGRAAAFEAASRAMARAGEAPADLCLCFATADHRGDLPPLIAAIRAITRARHVAGCTGATEGGDVGIGEEVVRGGGAGVLIEGVPRIAMGVARGCGRVGPLMTVPRARGNLIFELDGQPAFEPFARLCREPLLADLRRAAA